MGSCAPASRIPELAGDPALPAMPCPIAHLPPGTQPTLLGSPRSADSAVIARHRATARRRCPLPGQGRQISLMFPQAGFPQRNSCVMICTIRGENPGRTGIARHPTPAAGWRRPDGQSRIPKQRRQGPARPFAIRRRTSRQNGARRHETRVPCDRNPCFTATGIRRRARWGEEFSNRSSIGRASASVSAVSSAVEGLERRVDRGGRTGPSACHDQHVDIPSLHRHVGVKCR